MFTKIRPVTLVSDETLLIATNIVTELTIMAIVAMLTRVHMASMQTLRTP
jgi:hypothetical protein